MMDIDRRKFMALAGIAGALSASPGLAWAATEKRLFRASLGSSVLSSNVCFFWIGMHPKLNFYADEDIEAAWKGVQNQTQALGLLANRGQEVGGVGPSTLLGLAAKGTRVPLKVAYAHYQKSPYRGITTPGSGVKGWADLKGKKVGINSLGQLSTKWYAEAAVREAGLSNDDISFVPVGVMAPAGVALQNGAVDAYVSHHNHTSRIARLGFDVVDMPAPDFASRSFDGGMTINSDFLAEDGNREALARFFRAVAKGAVFSLENPRAAVQCHYDMFPASLPKTEGYEDALESATREYNLVLQDMKAEETDHNTYGMMSEEKWKTVAYEIMQLQEGDVPPLSEFYTNELLDVANDFDRDEIKERARNFSL